MFLQNHGQTCISFNDRISVNKFIPIMPVSDLNKGRGLDAYILKINGIIEN